MSEKRKKLNLNDFMNKKYGCLTIIGVVEPNTNIKHSKVRVKCDCGKESDKLLYKVVCSPSTCSKRCELFGIDRTRKTVDKYINKKFGYLTIRSYVGRATFHTKRSDGGGIQHRPIVRCECDCGRMVDFNLYLVTCGNIISCGQCKFSRLKHGLTVDRDTIATRLISTHNNIAKHASSIPEFQLSKEWFNDDDPMPAICNFVDYCKPLYEKVMNDGNPKHIFIHRIDISKPLGPGNTYFDHHALNIHCSDRVYY